MSTIKIDGFNFEGTHEQLDEVLASLGLHTKNHDCIWKDEGEEYRADYIQGFGSPTKIKYAIKQRCKICKDIRVKSLGWRVL